jgi:hypothetical protein
MSAFRERLRRVFGDQPKTGVRGVRGVRGLVTPAEIQEIRGLHAITPELVKPEGRCDANARGVRITPSETKEISGPHTLTPLTPAKPVGPEIIGRDVGVTGGRLKPWDAADYRALFDERAAILELDGGLARSLAEARATEHCVVEWLNRNPAASPAGHCAWCQTPEAEGAAVVPFGVGERHTWLHPHCWPAWHRRRRADALAALRSFGFPVPVATQPTERDTAAERRYLGALRIAAGQRAEPPSPEGS